jgi:hypothetical protein
MDEKFETWIVFGDDQDVADELQDPLAEKTSVTEDEIAAVVVERSFETLAERSAYLEGVGDAADRRPSACADFPWALFGTREEALEHVRRVARGYFHDGIAGEV